MRRLACLLVLSGIASPLVLAQNSEREKIAQMEAMREGQRQRAIRSQLDSAVILTDAGQYESANEKYRYVIDNLKSLPSDLTFHFGKNSYFLEKYAQSVDWLNKYIQLKGTGGPFYEDAVTWLKKAEQALLLQRQQQSEEAAAILSRNYDIDCGPTGKVTCPACKGSTVVIKKTYLGESYRTCTACARKGFLSCDEYNKLLRGDLKANP